MWQRWNIGSWQWIKVFILFYFFWLML
jgi:hypothetical protein